MDEAVIMRADAFVREHWEAFRPLVESALEHSLGEVSADFLRKRILGGKAQLWVVCNKGSFDDLLAVAVTEVVDYEAMGSLRVITLGGVGMAKWAQKLSDALELFCRENRLSRIEAVGRRGLEKKLDYLAFRPVYTVYVKEISYE